MVRITLSTCIGHDYQGDEAIPMEEYGNLLILASAHTKRLRIRIELSSIQAASTLSSNDAAGVFLKKPVFNQSRVTIEAFRVLTKIANIYALTMNAQSCFSNHHLVDGGGICMFCPILSRFSSLVEDPLQHILECAGGSGDLPSCYAEPSVDFSSPFQGGFTLSLDNNQRNWATSDGDTWHVRRTNSFMTFGRT